MTTKPSLLCLALLLPGCATSQRPAPNPTPDAPPSSAERSLEEVFAAVRTSVVTIRTAARAALGTVRTAWKVMLMGRSSLG